MIVHHSDPKLREPSRECSIEESLLLLPLLVKAWETYYWAVGIAAPQVGINICAFFYDPFRHAKKKKRFGMPILVTNPMILSRSEETETAYEGCLSCTLRVVPVTRSKSIVLKYLDETGREVTKKLEGFAARVAQHEEAHLRGELILDHVKQ